MSDIIDGVPSNEKQRKEISEKNIEAINKLDGSITRLNKSTSIANFIMIILTLAIFVLTLVMVLK